jgi:Mrp family chromosome partitioning ATPase
MTMVVLVNSVIVLCLLYCSGAVVVTTPQRLSLIDVVKGIDMFQDLKVCNISV